MCAHAIKIMLIGPTACGKTTLCQIVNGEKIQNVKTQVIYAHGNTIDTPGEYLENRVLMNALTTTAMSADLVIFVVDPLSDHCSYSPGHVSMFSCPVIGVVSKIDLATHDEIQRASDLLYYAGVANVFLVSGITGVGIKDLMNYLADVNEQRETIQ